MLGRRVLRPAVFLDRDGTLNVEVDYLADPRALVLLPGVGQALSELQRAGHLLVVVTNQSGVARGLFDEATLGEIHAALARALAEFGVVLDHVGYCPHHPLIGTPPYRTVCDCRKPQPGLLRVAAEELPIDLDRSWVVGDSARDLEAGAALGIPGILVSSGKGRAEAQRLTAAGRPPEHCVPDLAAAAALILQAGRGAGRPTGR